jgi:type II secretory pathway component PulF
MLTSPRIPLRKLAELSHRVGTALEAGIDMRAVWAREATRARGAAKRKLLAVSQSINRGMSLRDSLVEAKGYFPILFCELAAVGDVTGHQGEVFNRLAEHYSYQATLRRNFLASIAWPVTEFAIAAAIIGFLIWIMGSLGSVGGNRADLLGFGLVGTRGLIIYAAVLAAGAFAIWLTVKIVRSGAAFGRRLQRLVLYVPFIGPALQTLCLARLAWSLHLTQQAGMDIYKSVQLSLLTTRNARYVDQIPLIKKEIKSGSSLFEAFAGSGAYPDEFLDALTVSEQSGRIVESMELLSRQYQERARSALSTITMLAGFAVWILVAILIIFLIFRLFLSYINQLNSAFSW